MRSCKICDEKCESIWWDTCCMEHAEMLADEEERSREVLREERKEREYE